MQSNLPKRKSPRLKDYDYSTPRAYFITVCANEKKCLFGKIINGKMLPNDLGKTVELEILKIESEYSNIKTDKYIVMPNHIHMIITISAEGINPFPTKRYDIPNVIGKFKAGVTRNIGNSRQKPIWQSSYHDHVIRNETDYRKIWEYIDTNVIKWEKDCFFQM